MRKNRRKKITAVVLSVFMAAAAFPVIPAHAAGKKTAESLITSDRPDYNLADSLRNSYAAERTGANTDFMNVVPTSEGLDMATILYPDEPEGESATGAEESNQEESGNDLPVEPIEDVLVKNVNGVKVRVEYAGDHTSDFIEWERIDPTGRNDSTSGLNALMQKRLLDVTGGPDPDAWTLVYIPAGNYKIDGILWIPEKTWLYLEDGAVVTRSDPSSALAMAYSNAAGTAAPGGYSSFSGIVIEGGVWDGGNAGKTDGENFANMFLLRHGRNVVIRNSTFRNCIGHMLNLSGDENVLVENCQFTDMPDYTGDSRNYYTDGTSDAQKKARRLYTEAIHFDFMNEKGEPGDVSDGTPCRNCTVRYCTFTNCQRGVGTHHRISSDPSAGNYATGRAGYFTFTDNVFTGIKSEPYSLFSYEFAVIANTTVDTDQFFVEGIDLRYVLIIDSEIKKSTDKVINITDSERVAVSGLISRKNENGMPSIYFQNVKRSVIEKSTLAASSGPGISVKSCEKLYFYQNVITSPQGSAVRVDSSNFVTVRGNRISGGKLYGVEFTNASNDGLVLGNVIQNMSYHGICIQGSAAASCGAEIYYNTIDNCVGRGIVMNSATGKIRGNIIMNITDEDSSIKGNAIHIQDCAAGTTVFAIENNFIQKCNNAGIRITNSPSVRIAGNTFTQTGGTGIHAGNCNNAVITGNTAFDNAGAWTNVFVQSSSGVNVTNNVMISSGQAYFSDGVSYTGKNGNVNASWYYRDIKKSGWSAEYLLFCNRFGAIITGNNGLYNPGGKNITRQDFALILYRIMGEPAVTGTYSFSDKAGSWAKKSIIWANENGVVTGYTDAKGVPTGEFGCKDNIQRYQLALMMYRLAEKMGYDTSMRGDLHQFPDLSQSFFSSANMKEQREALSWAVGTGIITGKNGKIARKDTATREECATMITRFVKAYPELAGYFLTYDAP